jgi:hypothetical protein
MVQAMEVDPFFSVSFVLADLIANLRMEYLRTSTWKRT